MVSSGALEGHHTANDLLPCENDLVESRHPLALGTGSRLQPGCSLPTLRQKGDGAEKIAEALVNNPDAEAKALYRPHVAPHKMGRAPFHNHIAYIVGDLFDEALLSIEHAFGRFRYQTEIEADCTVADVVSSERDTVKELWEPSHKGLDLFLRHLGEQV